MEKEIRAFEAFPGYGSHAMALKRLEDSIGARSPHFTFVGISETDRISRKAYAAVHGEVENYGDIRDIDWERVPDFDLMAYTFPCGDLASGDDRTLLEGCYNGISSKRPGYLLMENVPEVLGPQYNYFFKKWMERLEYLGYYNYVRTINARGYVPQNRKRVFMVSMQYNGMAYTFPEPHTCDARFKDIMSTGTDSKWYVDKDDDLARYFAMGGSMRPRSTGRGVVRELFNLCQGKSWKSPQRGRVYSSYGISPALSGAVGGGGKEPKFLIMDGHPTVPKTDIALGMRAIIHTRFSEDDTVRLWLLTHGERKRLVSQASTGGLSESFVGRLMEFFDDVCVKLDARDQVFVVDKVIRKAVELAGSESADDARTYLDELTPVRPRIRRIAPNEALALMGVSFRDAESILSSHISDTAVYQRAASAVVVDVLTDLYRKMFVDVEPPAMAQVSLF